MSPSKQQFGTFLRDLRTRDARRMTQRELADKADLWPTHVSEIERGQRPCGPNVAVRLAQAMGLDGEDLKDFVTKAAETTERGSVWQDLEAEDYLLHLLELKIVNAGITPRKVVSASAVKSSRRDEAGDVLVVQSDGRAFYVEVRVTETEGLQ